LTRKLTSSSINCAVSRAFPPHNSGPPYVAFGSYKWNIGVSVALFQSPLIATQPSDIEQKFAQLCAKIDDEQSYKTDFELIMDKDRSLLDRRRQFEIEGKDLSELDEQLGISSIQKRDDWFQGGEEILEKFDIRRNNKLGLSDKNASSKSDRKLVLSIRQRFPPPSDPEYVSPWQFPILMNNGKESLRQTVDRCLGDVLFAKNETPGIRAYGNAPLAHLRYKYPKKLRECTGVDGSILFLYVVQLLPTVEKLPLNFNEPMVADSRWCTSEEFNTLTEGNRQYRSIIETILFE